METDLEMADESNSAEVDVVGDSPLVQPTNAYGSPIASAPSRVTASAVAVLKRVVSFGFVFYTDSSSALLSLNL